MRHLFALCLAAGPAFAADVTVGADAAAAYVEGCRKPNGAFGPADQAHTDAAWNYPAVRTLQLLGRDVTRPDAVLAHGLGTPAGHIGLGHYHFFHRHAIRHALGKPTEPRHRRVAVVVRGPNTKFDYYASPFGTAADLLFKTPGGSTDDPLDADGETFTFHNLASLHYLLAGLKYSGREPADPKPLVEYVRRRQAASGGFADSPDPADADASAAHTHHAVGCLGLLGALDAVDARKAEPFLHACRTDGGGYRWSPAVGGEADAYYTWAALEALAALGTKPRGAAETRAWLDSLQNADGGFGDRPGWRSRLYSTFYAVAGLAHLGARPTAKRVPRHPDPAVGDGLRVFVTQFKMPVVTPDDLDGLRNRGFHLLALKTDKFDLADPLLASIRERKLPMDVVLCPEMYPHRAVRPGGAVADHVGNFTLDPRWTGEQKATWQAADKAGGEKLPWAEYRDRVVRPVTRLGGLAYPEQDYDLEWANQTYGDGGYNAVLAGFNWPPYDFVRVFPWREKWASRLTPVADVDAHGDLAKWSPQLDHARTLFVARGPTFADFREAAANGRVVTVVAGADGGFAYYGPPAAVKFARERAEQWRWKPASP